jgi:ABC-type uncharacterized transport system substrate-binding protein
MLLQSIHRRIALALMCMAVPFAPACAHPHNYIQVGAAVVIVDGAVDALRYVWRFDTKYLDGLKDEYDTNRDGALSDEELQAWLAASIKNLETFKYFTFLRQGRDHIPLGSAERHRVERTADGLVLYFNVKPAKAIAIKAGPLQIDLYDRTFFTEFVLGDGRGVTVEAAGTPGTCSATVVLAPGSEQQKAITAFMKMFGRVDAKLSPAKEITVACKD